MSQDQESLSRSIDLALEVGAEAMVSMPSIVESLGSAVQVAIVTLCDWGENNVPENERYEIGLNLIDMSRRESYPDRAHVMGRTALQHLKASGHSEEAALLEKEWPGNMLLGRADDDAPWDWSETKLAALIKDLRS